MLTVTGSKKGKKGRKTLYGSIHAQKLQLKSHCLILFKLSYNSNEHGLVFSSFVLNVKLFTTTCRLVQKCCTQSHLDSCRVLDIMMSMLYQPAGLGTHFIFLFGGITFMTLTTALCCINKRYSGNIWRWAYTLAIIYYIYEYAPFC